MNTDMLQECLSRTKGGGLTIKLPPMSLRSGYPHSTGTIQDPSAFGHLWCELPVGEQWRDAEWRVEEEEMLVPWYIITY